MTKIGIGLDIGADSAKVVVGQLKKDVFVPLKAGLLKRQENGSIDLAPFLDGLGIKGEAVQGVTGKEMIIRYTQVTPMPDWQLKQVMGFEVDDLSAQSGGDLSADFNRLDITSSISEDDTVLLTLIKNSLLEEHMGLLKGSKTGTAGFAPNAVALYNLLSRTAEVGSGTTLILDIGADNIDLAIVQDGALIFARNLTGGSNLFNQALIETFSVRQPKAEKLKKEMGCIISRATSKNLSPQEEKVGRSLSAAAGRIYSMIQSSLMFCKAQIKVTDLSPDRVLLTGGGARLKGLDRYLSDNFDIPVKIFDPADVFDTSQMKDAQDFTDHSLELSCAMGLAIMGCTQDHYSIQVLPQAVKKRLYFKNHTLYGILAAVFLLAFLGSEFYFSMIDSALLRNDISQRERELKKRDRKKDEINRYLDENEKLTDALNLIDQKTIATTGLVRTFALIQQYLPEDLWITAVDIEEMELEELGTGKKKKPVIRVRGSGREMNQPLQKSFTEFRTKLENDPLTSAVIPQVRYGDNFSYT
ncbi:MAG: pilus assembly protein PilM, partial [Planctomycetes bacterium]|nr:pilus assembly protein PilM [Planctomycetota bacterium]